MKYYAVFGEQFNREVAEYIRINDLYNILIIGKISDIRLIRIINQSDISFYQSNPIFVNSDISDIASKECIYISTHDINTTFNLLEKYNIISYDFNQIDARTGETINLAKTRKETLRIMFDDKDISLSKPIEDIPELLTQKGIELLMKPKEDRIIIEYKNMTLVPEAYLGEKIDSNTYAYKHKSEILSKVLRRFMSGTIVNIGSISVGTTCAKTHIRAEGDYNCYVVSNLTEDIVQQITDTARRGNLLGVYHTSKEVGQQLKERRIKSRRW